MKKIFTTRNIALMAVLIALNIVLTRIFAFNTPIMRISVNFLPNTLIGMIFGPIGAAISMAIADFLGTMLFPSGPFFVGFTISAILTGGLYGFFYYKKEITWQRVIVGTFVITIVDSLILTPLWLSMMMESPMWAFVVPRLWKSLIMIPIQTILTYITLTAVANISIVKKFQMMK